MAKRKNANSRRLNVNSQQRDDIEQMRPILEQRARSAGVDFSHANLNKMRGPTFSDAAGQIIEAQARNNGHANDLWSAASHFRAAHERFRRAIDAPKSTPVGSSLTPATSSGSRILSEEDEVEESDRARRNYRDLIGVLGEYVIILRMVLIEGTNCRDIPSFVFGLELICKSLTNEKAGVGRGYGGSE